MNAISATGYPPERLCHCPRCGEPRDSYNLPVKVSNGKMKCEWCGLSCFIIEADDSEDYDNE